MNFQYGFQSTDTQGSGGSLKFLPEAQSSVKSGTEELLFYFSFIGFHFMGCGAREKKKKKTLLNFII